MRKIVFLLLCAVTVSVTVCAQDVFKEGDKVLNLGIGFGNTLYTGTGYSTTIPPLSGSFEVCVKDNLFDDKSSIGVGGSIGYTSAEYKHPFPDRTYVLKYSDFVLAARGALHYQFVEKLDTYGGLALGYDIVSSSASSGVIDNTIKASVSGFYLGAFIGARYYFNTNWAAMAEAGYDVAVLKVGIAYKF